MDHSAIKKLAICAIYKTDWLGKLLTVYLLITKHVIKIIGKHVQEMGLNVKEFEVWMIAWAMRALHAYNFQEDGILH